MHGFAVIALVIASAQAVGGAPWTFAFLLVFGYPQPAVWILCCYHRVWPFWIAYSRFLFGWLFDMIERSWIRTRQQERGFVYTSLSHRQRKTFYAPVHLFHRTSHMEAFDSLDYWQPASALNRSQGTVLQISIEWISLIQNRRQPLPPGGLSEYHIGRYPTIDRTSHQRNDPFSRQHPRTAIQAGTRVQMASPGDPTFERTLAILPTSSSRLQASTAYQALLNPLMEPAIYYKSSASKLPCHEAIGHGRISFSF